MPDINRRAQILAGRGHVFLDDDTVIGQRELPEGWRVCTWAYPNGTPRKVAEQGCSAIAARAGHWRAWLDGALFPPVPNLPAGAGLLAELQSARGVAAADGTIALLLDFQAGAGLRLLAADGSFIDVPDARPQAVSTCVVSRTQAVWMEGSEVRTLNLPVPKLLPGPVYWPHVLTLAGQLWITYHSTDERGVVLHPFNSFDGYAIVQPPAFYLVAMARDPDTALLAWGLDPGDEATASREINVTREPRQSLLTDPSPVPSTTPVPALRPPAVTVDGFTLDELRDGREIVFHDRENPAFGYASRVWVENGSIYASMTNAAGTGRTGARRPVKPCEAAPAPAPVDPIPHPQPVRPTRDEVLANLRADIAMTDVEGQDTEWGTWEALWWTDHKFTEFAERYKARGLKLVPCNLVVTNYRGVTFDFTQDLALAKDRLERCYAHGLIPLLCLTMVDARDRGAETIAILERILPELREHLVAVFTAWELEVDGGPSVFTPEEHARVIALADQHLPDVVIGVEFASPADRNDPVIYDGRAVGDGREAPDYWRRPEAQRIDVVLLELPYGITNDPRRVCMEVGGAVCRLQGAFDVPAHWPDGEPITDEYLGNWRTDYGIHRRVCLFEYAAFQRWSSERKRALREFVESVIPISGFGEG